MSYVQIVTKTDGHSNYSSEAYGEWSQSTNTYIEGIRVQTEKAYRDLTSSFDIEWNATYFLLYAEYGAGDSFGNSTGNFEPIWLYKDYDLAMEAKEAITDETCDIPIEDGKRYKEEWPAWKGYFETLEHVSVEPVRRVT